MHFLLNYYIFIIASVEVYLKISYYRMFIILSYLFTAVIPPFFFLEVARFLVDIDNAEGSLQQ